MSMLPSPSKSAAAMPELRMESPPPRLRMVGEEEKVPSPLPREMASWAWLALVSPRQMRSSLVSLLMSVRVQGMIPLM